MVINTFSIVVAVDSQFGIGKGGALPWHLPAELKRFKALTMRPAPNGKPNLVIMGRKTWESLPDKFKPLPGRVNCVLTRNVSLSFPAQVIIAAGLAQALDLAAGRLRGQIGEIFVIGGAQVFTEALRHPFCEKIYLTEIQNNFNCDTFFPSELSAFKKISESDLQAENNLAYSFVEFQRK